MEDNLFDKLREMSGKYPEKLNILEEQIDVKLQLEYFRFSKKIKEALKNEKWTVDQLPDIENQELLLEQQKEILVKLASTDDPKAYRILEEFVKSGNPELHEWGVLALQESKMLLESTLLNENQIFISTGLGGKGNMLRYFVVLIGEGIDEFAEFQQKMVTSEFGFALDKNKSQLEKIEFQERFVTLTTLIPFEVSFQQVLRTALEECNQYGNFLKSNFLVTNVKALSLDEIKDFVDHDKIPDSENYDQIDFETLNDTDES